MSTVTYNLGPVALIPLGEGRLFEAGSAMIAVFRTRDGRVHATDAWCPHRGGPLADGIVAAGKVVCPLHGYMFELETGAPIHHECRRLRTYAITLDDRDEMLVTMRRRETRSAPDVFASGDHVTTDHAATISFERDVQFREATGAPSVASVSHSMGAPSPPFPPVSVHQGERGAGGVRGCLSVEEISIDG